MVDFAVWQRVTGLCTLCLWVQTLSVTIIMTLAGFSTAQRLTEHTVLYNLNEEKNKK